MDRNRLKNWAKDAFYRSYWKSVLVALILSITVGAATGGGGGSSSSSSMSSMESMSDEEIAIFLGILLVVLIVAFVMWLIGALLKAFLLNPLQVGCQAYFCDGLYNTDPKLGLMGTGFKTNYKNVTKTMFLKDMYLWLWSLIALIPFALVAVVMVFLSLGGSNVAVIIICMVVAVIAMIPCYIPMIVKSYEYLLIPYILTENPDMPSKEVFALSKKMMMGNKWEAFVLHISFLGWFILSACTCGILAIFYVEPYRCYTFAAFYRTLQQRNQYINGSMNNSMYSSMSGEGWNE